MKLLVWDEGMGVGEIERFTCSMLPRLAGLTERLAWLCPEYRHQDYREWMGPGAAVELLSSTGSGTELAPRVYGRLARWSGSFLPRISRKLGDRRTLGLLRQAIAQTQATHLLVPALFDQSFPELEIPVYAVVCDINYPPHWKDECLGNLQRWAVGAAGIICISEFTRQEVLRVVGSLPDRVVSIPIAADLPPAGEPRLTPGNDSPPVLLYPSSFNAHKGHVILLQALLNLWEKGVRFRLVLTGGATERVASPVALPKPKQEEVRNLVAQAPVGFKEAIVARGFVSAGELEEAYAAVSVVVLPSLYEGFGLPLSEALFRGKMVVCSDIPAFREQVERYEAADRVKFVEPGNVTAWQEALKLRLSSGCPPGPTKAEIQTLASRWTWQHVAEGYFQFMSGSSRPVRPVFSGQATDVK